MNQDGPDTEELQKKFKAIALDQELGNKKAKKDKLNFDTLRESVGTEDLSRGKKASSGIAKDQMMDVAKPGGSAGTSDEMSLEWNMVEQTDCMKKFIEEVPDVDKYIDMELPSTGELDKACAAVENKRKANGPPMISAEDDIFHNEFADNDYSKLTLNPDTNDLELKRLKRTDAWTAKSALGDIKEDR